jgi:hypothetical protein
MSRWAAVKDVPELRELYFACLTAASGRLHTFYPRTGSPGTTTFPTEPEHGAQAVVDLADHIFDSVVGQQ